MASSSSFLGRHRGHVSLTLAATGLVACETATQFGVLPPAAGRVLTTVFEGATVGGLADWFAVSALFHRIPIPGIASHTDLLALRRDRLADGIVDMVETQWLSPAVLRERLAGVSFADMLADYLRDPHNRDGVRRALRALVLPLTVALEHPVLVSALGDALQRRLMTLDLARLAGGGLQEALRDEGFRQRLGDGLADALNTALDKPALRHWLRDTVRAALADYADEGWWESAKLKLVKLFVDGEDDSGKIDHLLDTLAGHLGGVLDAVRADPAHPLRQGLIDALARWAERASAEGSPPLQALSAALVQQLGASLGGADGPLAGWLAATRHELDVELANAASVLSQRLDALIGSGIVHFITHADTRNGFDAILRRLIVEVIETRPQLIGDTVRLSLSEERLPTRALVRQIEDKVGDELQWIRVNGAVVGGLVAGAIALLRLALGG